MAAKEGWHASTGRAFGGPGKYIQRAGEIDRLGEHHDGARLRRIPAGRRLRPRQDGCRDPRARSDGPASRSPSSASTASAAARRSSASRRWCKSAGAAIVVGIGGGKTIDTAKLAAVANRRPHRHRADHRLDRRALQRHRGALFAGRHLSGIAFPRAQSRHRRRRQRPDRQGAGALPRRRHRRCALDLVRGALQPRIPLRQLRPPVPSGARGRHRHRQGLPRGADARCARRQARLSSAAR